MSEWAMYADLPTSKCPHFQSSEDILRVERYS